MPRAGKGTFIRKATLDLYASEIEVLYGTSGANTTSGSGAGQYLDAKDAAKSIISRTTSIDLAGVPADANLFELGLDSLQVTAPGHSDRQGNQQVSGGVRKALCYASLSTVLPP